MPCRSPYVLRSSTSDLAGGIYSYIDNDDRLVLVNAAGELMWISHQQSATGKWQLVVDDSVQIGYDSVVGLVPDYEGRIWFATAAGNRKGLGAVVGYYDPSDGSVRHRMLRPGEQVANSISSAPNGVAVASTYALYLFNVGKDGRPEVTWRKAYDRGPARKPGQLSWGTGATPTFFGPRTGYEYVTITDNAVPFRRRTCWFSAAEADARCAPRPLSAATTAGRRTPRSDQDAASSSRAPTGTSSRRRRQRDRASRRRHPSSVECSGS